MSLQNTSRHSADLSLDFDGADLAPKVIEGCTVTRAPGWPVGVFDVYPDRNVAGSWSPSDCLIHLSGVFVRDDILPISLPNYRWIDAGDGSFFVRVRMLAATDFGVDFADLPFCLFIERKN